MKDYEEMNYRKFTTKSEFDKAIHTLEGLITGIGIDNKLNKLEIDEIHHWIEKSERLFNKDLYKEIVTYLNLAIEDNFLSSEEKDDILWICKKFKTENKFYDIITSDIQRLQGILHGIIADKALSTEEILGLKKWLFDNEHLQGVYPYDELCSLIIEILKDGKVDKQEENLLKVFFSEFIELKKSNNINIKEIEELKKTVTIKGICAIDPLINFENNYFCFTGVSVKAKRIEIKKIVEKNGGLFTDSIRKDLKYLIVGGEGNPCWAYSCYGRKVESAMEMRKNGSNLIIAHEIDFWDALA